MAVGAVGVSTYFLPRTLKTRLFFHEAAEWSIVWVMPLVGSSLVSEFGLSDQGSRGWEVGSTLAT